MAEHGSRPRIFVPPPLVFVAGWLVAVLLSSRREFEIDAAGASPPQEALGVGLGAAGLLLMLWGGATFLRARTPVLPVRPARQMVTGGPYRLTRNPMYLGMTGAYLGLAVLLNQAWPVVVLPAVLGILDRFVVRREEAHLHARFGEEYDAYRRRVRRWL
jgi:protein-S-isoprenylcysteine O-methyltransferase Ste14